jgi:hypothetical protein
MFPDTCGVVIIFAGMLYILWHALNLPDDASFELGSKLEL